MKKQFLFAALAVATLFTACSKEEELSKNEGGTPVNFVIGGIGARTVTDANYGATFEANDEVGLFSTGLASDMANVKYTVNAAKTGLDTEDQTEYVFDEGDATFYAYYPWATGLTSSTVGLTIKTDQNITNDADNFNCNDLLIATATGSSESTDGVTLKFDHVMSFVEVSFGTNLSTIGVSSVTMKVQPTITYNFTSSEATKYTVSGDAIDITMYKNGVKFWAIVPPQTISAGTALFTITANNSRTYTYTVAADQTEEFNSNNIRKIKLDVTSEEDPSTATVFKIASIDINGWGNIDDVEEVKGVEEGPLNLTAPINSNMIFNDVASFKNISVEGWAKTTWVKSAVFNETENAIYIVASDNTTSTTDKHYWNNHALYYYAGNATVKVGKTYTLTFKVKRGSTASSVVSGNTKYSGLEYFVFKQDNNTAMVYRVDDNNAGGNSDFSSAGAGDDGYNVQTISIDPSKHYTSPQRGSTALTYTDADYSSSSIVIGFRPTNLDAGDFYIKDVTLVENE